MTGSGLPRERGEEEGRQGRVDRMDSEHLHSPCHRDMQEVDASVGKTAAATFPPLSLQRLLLAAAGAQVCQQQQQCVESRSPADKPREREREKKKR